MKNLLLALPLFLFFVGCNNLTADNPITPPSQNIAASTPGITEGITDGPRLALNLSDTIRSCIRVEVAHGTAFFAYGETGFTAYGNYQGGYFHGNVYGTRSYGTTYGSYSEGGTFGYYGIGPYGFYAMGTSWDFYGASGKPSYLKGRLDIDKSLGVRDTVSAKTIVLDGANVGDIIKDLQAQIDELKKENQRLAAK